jgi:hypothetical protein
LRPGASATIGTDTERCTATSSESALSSRMIVESSTEADDSAFGQSTA